MEHSLCRLYKYIQLTYLGEARTCDFSVEISDDIVGPKSSSKLLFASAVTVGRRLLHGS